MCVVLRAGSEELATGLDNHSLRSPEKKAAGARSSLVTQQWCSESLLGSKDLFVPLGLLKCSHRNLKLDACLSTLDACLSTLDACLPTLDGCLSTLNA